MVRNYFFNFFLNMRDESFVLLKELAKCDKKRYDEIKTSLSFIEALRFHKKMYEGLTEDLKRLKSKT